MEESLTYSVSHQRKFRIKTAIKTKMMKKLVHNSITILSLVMILFFYSSCKKDIVSRTDLYPSLAPTNLDLNADTWKPVLITNPSVFAVAAPDGLTSPAYVADLNEIKAYQRSLTDDQRAI